MTAAAFIDRLQSALDSAKSAQAVCISQLEMAKAIALLRAGEAMRGHKWLTVDLAIDWDKAAAMSTEWREVPR